MPVYLYSGFAEDGRSRDGVIDAESPGLARQKLRRRGVFPVDLAEASRDGAAGGRAGLRSVAGRPPSLQEVAEWCRHLGTLLAAGLPVVDALTVLLEQAERPRAQTVLARIREDLRQGRTLSAAMQDHPGVFPALAVPMVRAGEASGSLDRVLADLADHLDRRLALRHQIASAMLYPGIMLAVSLAVLAGVMVFVVPRLTAVFADLGATLPWPTRLLIALSRALTDYGALLLLGAGAAGLAAWRLATSDAGRLLLDRARLRVPVLGAALRKAAIARFARTLAALLESGVPVLEALSVARGVLSNRALERVIDRAQADVREGQPIARPLRRSGEFPGLVTRLIAVGEGSGELEGMLSRVAEIYERDVERTIRRLTTAMEPAMVLLMGAAVFFIVVAILLPIFEMSRLVG